VASGFARQSPAIRLGNTIATPRAHLLLVGRRGDLAFRESSARSWLLCNRPKDGQAPDEIRNLIEATSPGPHLQVFGSKPPRNANWTVCPIPTRQ
jgi:hypothetical protein